MQSNMLKSAGDLSAFPSAYPGITYCQDLDFTSRHVTGSSWSPVVQIRGHTEAHSCFLLPPALSCSLHQFLSGGMGEEVLYEPRCSYMVMSCSGREPRPRMSELKNCLMTSFLLGYDTKGQLH